MGLFSVVGSIIGGSAQKKAASKAADAQVRAAQLAIDEQRRQFDATQNNLAPYLASGTSALSALNALMGLSTPVTSTTDWEAYVRGNPDAMANWNAIKGTSSDSFGGDISSFGEYHYNKDGARRDLTPYTTTTGGAVDQQGAIDALKASPLYTSLYRNGEEAVLSNAAATGGLRGGNTQSALYNLGADTLSNVIQNQLANLGGIASLGSGTATSLGQFGQNAATNIGNSLTSQGQAQAGAALTKGGINSSMWNNIGSGLDSALASALGGGGLSSVLKGVLV